MAPVLSSADWGNSNGPAGKIKDRGSAGGHGWRRAGSRRFAL